MPVEMEKSGAAGDEEIKVIETGDMESAVAVSDRNRRKPGWKRIAITAAAVIAVLLAFIIEMTDSGTQKPAVENAPPPSRSDIQDELSRLDWVVPAFLPINEYSRPGKLISEVNGIVIHYVGNPNTTAAQNRSYFANLAYTGETYASSNFIVCLDGGILQCVPVDEIAYASNVRNADTLSIELCHPDDTGEFTDETYASAVLLTAWLCKEYGLRKENVIRHFDVSGKECPRYFVLNEEAWETFKADVERTLHDLL